MTQPLDASKLRVVLSENQTTCLPPLESLKFGNYFSSHMMEVDWDIQKGWGAPVIRPVENLSLHPATSVFHYGLEVFEGLKAFRFPDSSISMFRPDMNIQRLHRSCERMCLPTFDKAELLQLLAKLVKLESQFVPDKEGYSLYIRPFVISTQPTLGVSPPQSAKMVVLCSPVGPYFAEGFKPVKILADSQHVRAWPGGVGECKTGGNYGATIMPQQKATELGCSQVLWLFPTQDDFYVTEAGTMNVFIYWKNSEGVDELTTFPLENNLILPGVTRDSLLHLAKEMNEFQVVEKRVRMKADLLTALSENRVYEIFGAGTACIVTPVGCIHFDGKDYPIPLGKDDCGKEQGIGPVGEKLLTQLKAIQYGRAGSHPWCFEVDKVLKPVDNEKKIQRC